MSAWTQIDDGAASHALPPEQPPSEEQPDPTDSRWPAWLGPLLFGTALILISLILIFGPDIAGADPSGGCGGG